MSYPTLNIDDITTIDDFFSFVDTNSDQFITKEEIKEACAVDINNDGIITENEKNISSNPWLNSYFVYQDTNKDNKISLTELLQYNNDTKNE